MTRKHFRLLADEIARIISPLARLDAATGVAIACKGINPAFNKDRFFTACGVAP